MHSRRIHQQRKRGRERQRASNERGRDDDDDEESEKSACVVSKSEGICRNRFPSLARQRAAPLRKMRVERRERDVSSLQRGRAKMQTTNLVSARGRAAAASDMPWLASSGCTVVVKSPAAPSAPAAAAGAPRPPLDETNSERRCCSRRFMSFFWIENERPTSSRARKRFSKRVESRERSVCLPFFSTVGSHFFFLLFSLFKPMTRNQNVSSGGGGGGAYILDRSLVPRIRLLAQVRAHAQTRAQQNKDKKGRHWAFL